MHPLAEKFVASAQPGKLTPFAFAGEMLYIKELTARQLEQWQEWVGEQEGKGVLRTSYRAKLAVMCLCDETGKFLFTDGDVPTISDLATSVIEDLWQACRLANGLDKKAVEDAEKN